MQVEGVCTGSFSIPFLPAMRCSYLESPLLDWQEKAPVDSSKLLVLTENHTAFLGQICYLLSLGYLVRDHSSMRWPLKILPMSHLSTEDLRGIYRRKAQIANSPLLPRVLG